MRVTACTASRHECADRRLPSRACPRDVMIALPNLKKRAPENGSNGHAAPAAPSYDVAALTALVQRAETAAAALQALDSQAASVAALEERVTRLAAQLAGADAVGQQLT